jgi:urea transport system ATP-binding protein
MGYLRPTSGAIEIGEVPLRGLSRLDRGRASVSYCPQERVVFDDLTVAENLTLMRSGKPLDEFEPYFATFPRLKERLTQHAGSLSGGEKKLLSLVRALSERRSVIVLDEPTEGVQFENVYKMAQLINERKAQGAAFVIAEQKLNFVYEVASEIIVMNHGEIVLAGRRDELDSQKVLGHLSV